MGASTPISVSALPFRAYCLIYNEWYRDQNLQDSIVFSKGDGPDSYVSFDCLRRGKRHDYFTSCLPWPQKGDPVSIPIGDQAPISGIGVTTATNGVSDGTTHKTAAGDEVWTNKFGAVLEARTDRDWETGSPF